MRSNFAILDFLEIDIMVLTLPAKKLGTYVMRQYEPESDFTCVNHLDLGFNFATNIIGNIFFNNKQKLSRNMFLVLKNVK